MKTTTRFVLRHTVAYLGSFFVVLILVWTFVTPIIGWLLTGTIGSVYVEPPGNFIWCCCYLNWFTAICFPVSTGAEMLLSKHLKICWWLHVPTMAVVYLCIALVMWEAIGLMFSGRLSVEGLVYGIEDAILGISYWSILRASDTLMVRRFNRGQLDPA